MQITVRGTAEEVYPAERATASLAVAIEGPDKDAVARAAAGVQEPLVEQLEQLADRGAVSRWDAGQVRVHGYRPYDGEGRRTELVYAARLRVTAEFVDFERLSGFVDYWAGREGVEIEGVAWDVTAKNRRAYESDVRRLAVEDAVHKAQGYANAVRKGRVVPLEFADPGMLDQAPHHPEARMARAAVMSDGGPALALTPEEITVSAAVDARFTTEG